MNHLSTDVLIIGAGGAGLRAAIEARKQGVRVLLISKGGLGTGCCTAAAMGSFRVGWEDNDIEEHFNETLRAGRHLNSPTLVKILVNEAGPALRDLEELGIDFHAEKGKASLIAFRQPAGIALSGVLAKKTRELGVEVIEKAFIFNLLVKDSRCEGALALLLNKGETLKISSKATIVATGGFAGLYLRNDNPPGITGSGIILAFQAGAELRDLEFIQFQPAFLDRGVPRLPILDWLIEGTKNLVPGGPLINKKGERFLSKYDLLSQKIFRDNLIVAIEKEISEEKEGQQFVRLDLRELAPADIEKAFDSAFQRQMARRYSFRLSLKPLRVAPSAHYTMGGVQINEKCETTVEGLYAAGEVAGGIHGANRLGGNALTEIIVFGKIAGRNAAEFAKNSSLKITNGGQFMTGQKTIQILAGNNKKGKYPPSTIKKDVRATVSRYLRPLRSKEMLLSALEELGNIEEKIPYINYNSLKELQEAVESRFIVLLGKLVAMSSLARKESRGPHFRTDFPESNDANWLKNIIIKKKDGEPKLFIGKSS